MIEDSFDNIQKCVCERCPSHNKCMKERTLTLFCSRGKSSCDVHSHGCICNECAVAKENNLTGSYYCEKGL